MMGEGIANGTQSGKATERPENRHVDERVRRRPSAADATHRPTVRRFRHIRDDSGAAGAGPSGFGDLTQAPHGRPDGRRRTATVATAPWNVSNDLTNGPTNGVVNNGVVNNGANGSTAGETNREGGAEPRLRTGWELPELLRPLPRRRQRPTARTPKLQPHQPALLEFIYQSRFATASQVQRRYPQWLRSQRTTQWQLANLVKLGYLATVPVRSTSPNFPFVYFTTGKGVSLINETYADHGIDKRHAAGEGRKARGVAVESVLHELMLTEFELAVKQTVEARDDLTLLTTERRYYRREQQLRYWQHGKERRVIPDAGFIVRTGKPSEPASQNACLATMLNLVEFDNGTMSPQRVLSKLKQYAAWADSEAGQNYLRKLYARFDAPLPRAGFRLLVIAHDKLHRHGDRSRLVALFEQSLALPAAMRDRLWWTTAADLKSRQHAPAPLASALWYRSRDAKAWLSQYADMAEHKPNRDCRRFVHTRLSTLPRHPLFVRHSPNDGDRTRGGKCP